MRKYLITVLLVICVLLASCNDTVQMHTQSGIASECEHIDVNDDGKCDSCKTDVTVTLDVYAINDLHGKIDDTSANEGVDELTTYLKNCRASDECSIVLSSGDMWQGTSESNLTYGKLVTEWMNEIGISSMTLGNHEFDWGTERIADNAKIASFPFLAINVFDRQTNERAEYCAPSVMVRCGELNVGIIGAIGDCYSSISPDKVEDVYFKTGNALTELVKAESESLRANGADVIVYSLHDGHSRTTNEAASVTGNEIASYYDVQLSRDGFVDVVFEGHTHRKYILKDTYGVYHLQGGGDNDGISHFELEINKVNGKDKVTCAEFVPVSRYDSLNDDPYVDVLLEKYKDDISLGTLSIGTNKKFRSGDEMRKIVAEMYYQKGLQVWGSRYDVVLGGGFISVRSPGNLPQGEITYSQIQTLFPFDNPLMLCSIKGSDLKSKFIETSNSNYFVSYSDGLLSSLDPDETYYVVVDTYTSTYAPNRLTEIEMYNPNIFARDLVADYIAAGGLA